MARLTVDLRSEVVNINPEFCLQMNEGDTSGTYGPFDPLLLDQTHPIGTDADPFDSFEQTHLPAGQPSIRRSKLKLSSSCGEKTPPPEKPRLSASHTLPSARKQGIRRYSSSALKPPASPRPDFPEGHSSNAGPGRLGSPSSNVHAHVRFASVFSESPVSGPVTPHKYAQGSAHESEDTGNSVMTRPNSPELTLGNRAGKNSAEASNGAAHPSKKKRKNLDDEEKRAQTSRIVEEDALKRHQLDTTTKTLEPTLSQPSSDALPRGKPMEREDGKRASRPPTAAANPSKKESKNLDDGKKRVAQTSHIVQDDALKRQKLDTSTETCQPTLSQPDALPPGKPMEREDGKRTSRPPAQLTSTQLRTPCKPLRDTHAHTLRDVVSRASGSHQPTEVLANTQEQQMQPLTRAERKRTLEVGQALEIGQRHALSVQDLTLAMGNGVRVRGEEGGDGVGKASRSGEGKDKGDELAGENSEEQKGKELKEVNLVCDFVRNIHTCIHTFIYVYIYIYNVCT